MPYREVRVVDCLEVLRRWLARDRIRPIARSTRLDRKTVRRFVEAAAKLGFKPGDAWPDDSAVAAFVNSVKPLRPPTAPGDIEKVLLDHRDRVRQWVEQDELRSRYS